MRVVLWKFWKGVGCGMRFVNMWVSGSVDENFGFLYDMAYRCYADDLKDLLERIEFEHEHVVGSDFWLLRAKTVVTTRLLNK